MKNFLSTLLFLTATALLLLQTGCVTRTRPLSVPIANLDTQTQIKLPPPTLSAPAATLYREQLLHATANGRTHTLHTVLEIDGQKIKLAGLTTLGLRLFRLTYENQSIQVETLSRLPDKLPSPAQVLSDIMLAYWPVESWLPQLPDNWTLADKSPSLRILLNPQNTPVLEIHYATTGTGQRADPQKILHHIFNYEITITPIDAE